MTDRPAQFTDLIDLAAERAGGSVLLANDEFFAPKEALIKTTPAEWREGVYNERGKWMDGWETRRRRTPGYDWCIVRLGIPGIIRGVVVDTSFFRGNYPESCSIEAAAVEGTPDAETVARAASWTEILARSPLQGDSRNEFVVQRATPFTHLRLNIYPDGGVARLRVHGEGYFDARRHHPGSEIDLAAAENGGQVLLVSDMFFGNRHNAIMPGRSTHMGDGWETRRRRGPGHDWAIVKLATRGTVHRVEVDTDHYKGNAPGRCMVESCDARSVPNADIQTLASRVGAWRVLLGETPLEPHTRHRFTELTASGPATHVRLNIYPDGGIARLRLYGMPESE
ncbi:MAG: allantoicase [Myxococcales bacterium]